MHNAFDVELTTLPAISESHVVHILSHINSAAAQPATAVRAAAA
jgi:hypothetical protein